MPQTLWFPLRKVAALLTDHPDTGASVPLDLVLYIDRDIRLHSPAHNTDASNRLWPSCPHDVYPVGCGKQVNPAPYKAVTGGWALLPMDADLPAGGSIAEGIRRGARAGARWLAIAVDFDGALQPVVTAHRNTLPAPGGQWTPGLVHTVGLPGPYPALVATGGRHGTAVSPAFTLETIARIATDTQSWGSDDPTAPVVQLRRGQVSIAHPGADGTWRTHLVDPTSFGYLPLPGHWAWQLTDPAGWPDPHRPWPCTCPPACTECDRPLGAVHDLYCPWLEGDGGDTPRIKSRDLTVADTHRHEPGCPRAVAPPGPLFTPVSDHDEQCAQCASVNTCQLTVIDPSFGGTTETHQRCTHCGASWSHCNLSAVI